jgi:hypothetical protein
MIEAMEGYRAYVIGLDGHVLQRHDLWCATEGDARQRAEQLVDGHDVELWHLDLRIAIFRHGPASE